jgi:hypothetical protein
MIHTLAHLSNEPHMALSAVLAVFGCGLLAGVCAGLFIARKTGRDRR